MTYEFEAKTEREAIELAVSELGLEKDQFDVEILEIQKNSLFKKGYAKIRIHVDESLRTNCHTTNTETDSTNCKSEHFSDCTKIDLNESAEKVKSFVTNLIKHMGLEATVTLTSSDKKHLAFRIDTDNPPALIGKKGRHLDSIQLLTNAYASVAGIPNTRIILDCESYRMHREESLVRMAYDIADKVRISKRSRLMDPLNPYERRIIHTTLNAINDIETKSEGTGLYKQVRVFFKG